MNIKKMEPIEVLNKINEIFEEFKKEKGKEIVLVMHPSAMMLVKGKISRCFYNRREAFIFDDKITLFPSLLLPKNHFSFMTNDEYETNFNSMKS